MGRYKKLTHLFRLKIFAVIIIIFLIFSFDLIRTLKYNISKINSTAFSFNAESSTPFITGNGFVILSDYILDDYINNLEPIEKIKNGDVIFVKTEFARKFFKSYLTKLTKKIILITHNSDYSLSLNYKKYLNNENLIVWFAQNPSFLHPKLIPIPIGFENSCWRPQNLEFIRKLDLKSLKPWNERKILLYINFNYRTNSASRKSLLSMFKNYKNVLIITEKVNYSTYMKHLSDSKFVLCPKGNGIDTHRFYETILMGSIPIVEHTALYPMYNESTVLMLNDLTILTPQMLNKPDIYVKNMNFSRNVISFKYWSDKIDSFKKNLVF